MAAALILNMPAGASLSTKQPDVSAPQPSQDQQSSPDAQPPDNNSQTSSTNQATSSKEGQKPASKRHKPPLGQKPPGGGPRKIVIRRGSTPEATAQLAPGMSEQKANQQRQNTELLLTTTESSLQQLETRTLNARDQETMSQIRNYMAGSRSALKDNDPQRAHTLAFKAHLLADELSKH